jgi:hypothetical protein
MRYDGVIQPGCLAYQSSNRSPKRERRKNQFSSSTCSTGLAGDAVEPRIGVELDVARVVAGLQQLGDATLVAIFRGADEVVVTDVEA